MTTAAEALADSSGLPDYGGRTVVRSTVSIRNAGDGLSEGLAIDPVVLPVGSTQYVVLECIVHAHDHDRLMDKGSDTGLLVLDQVLKAGVGTLIDATLVAEVIATQAERIQKARDDAAGRARLPFPDELQKAHEAGDHSGGLVEGCPLCDDEKRVHEAEQRDAAGDDPLAEPTPIAGRANRAQS